MYPTVKRALPELTKPYRGAHGALTWSPRSLTGAKGALPESTELFPGGGSLYAASSQTKLNQRPPALWTAASIGKGIEPAVTDTGCGQMTSDDAGCVLADLWVG